MTGKRRPAAAGLTLACAVIGGCRSAAPPASGSGSKDRAAIAQALPPMAGDRLKVTVVEVSYGPGGSSRPHSHPCPVIGYVMEGVLRTQVKGGPEAIYRAGESFYEEANAVHLISANGSDSKPVRFLAYFTCDQDTPLSVAVPGPARGTPP